MAKKESHWQFCDNDCVEAPEGYSHFVYLISKKATCDGPHYYIGKKSIDGGTKWQNYYGSSKALKEDVKKYGKDKFLRIIMAWTKSGTTASWVETCLICKAKALTNDTYYNKYLQVRVNVNQMTDMNEVMYNKDNNETVQESSQKRDSSNETPYLTQDMLHKKINSNRRKQNEHRL